MVTQFGLLLYQNLCNMEVCYNGTELFQLRNENNYLRNEQVIS